MKQVAQLRFGGTGMSAEVWTAVGTVGGVVASFWLSVWRMKHDRRIAEAAASRSEAAARLTEEYTARIVDAVEQIAAKGIAVSGSGAAAQPASLVRWTLNHERGDTYRLTNTGNARAHGVEVTAHESLIGPRNVNGGPELASGEALTFAAAAHWGTSDKTITVTWSDDEGNEETWRYPLPTRPPR